MKIKQAAEALNILVAYLTVESGKMMVAQISAFSALMTNLPNPVFVYCRTGTRSESSEAPAAGVNSRDYLHESPRDVAVLDASQDNTSMKQSSLGLSNTVKRTRKREFFDAMELVSPGLNW